MLTNLTQIFSWEYKIGLALKINQCNSPHYRFKNKNHIAYHNRSRKKSFDKI